MFRQKRQLDVRETFFESYISTYLEKDVSRMINVGRLDEKNHKNT